MKFVGCTAARRIPVVVSVKSSPYQNHQDNSRVEWNMTLGVGLVRKMVIIYVFFLHIYVVSNANPRCKFHSLFWWAKQNDETCWTHWSAGEGWRQGDEFSGYLAPHWENLVGGCLLRWRGQRVLRPFTALMCVVHNANAYPRFLLIFSDILL